MEGESLAACAVMGFHYEDESDLRTGSHALICLLLPEYLTSMLCKYDWRFPYSLHECELHLKWLPLGK